MKSSLLTASMLAATLIFTHSAYAQTINDELTDKVQEHTIEAELNFEQIASCDALDERIQNWVETNKKYRNKYRYPMVDDMIMETVGFDTAASPEAGVGVTNEKGVVSSTNDFSTTNIQKQGIDEPDIYKTDGDILYYYNDAERMVYLIQSPLDRVNQTITLSDMTILSQIAIPERLSSSNLYIYDDQLIIVGNRWKQQPHRRGRLPGNEMTYVATYDVSNAINPSLLTYTEYDGALLESRLSLTDGTLMVMTTVTPSWDMSIDEEDEIDIQLPRTISVSPSDTGWQSTLEQISCEKTYLLLPDEQTIKQVGTMPSFTTVHTKDLDNGTVSDYAAFGTAGQVHVSADYLYLTQSLWLPEGRYACPIDARCVMPWFRGGNENTLVHGFERDGIHIDYIGSNLVEGSPLHDQYSMDEYDGSLRFLTQVRNPTQNTHLWILDQKLNLAGKLTNIQKGERFQGSRFIDDKLYLITFEQVDPLFVIDMANQTDPTIIGELKMPGRSNYLHPLPSDNPSVQYLIGVGYDAGENERGGTSREGVKLDLYVVHYDEKETGASLCGSLDKQSDAYTSCLEHVDTNRLRVERLDSLVFGEAESYTPVADNPRLFVWREDLQQLTLPLLEKKISKKIKRCTVIYEDEVATETENCRSDTQYEDSFAGYKVISIDPTQGADALSIETERNYIEQLNQIGDVDERHGLNQWSFLQMGPRVAFAGDAQLFFTNYFVDARVANQSLVLPLASSGLEE